MPFDAQKETFSNIGIKTVQPPCRLRNDVSDASGASSPYGASSDTLKPRLCFEESHKTSLRSWKGKVKTGLRPFFTSGKASNSLSVPDYFLNVQYLGTKMSSKRLMAKLSVRPEM